jgi:hypothetical protein
MMRGQPDAGELLRASVPHLVPERVVEVASTRAGCPVAAYVLDVEGSFALRLAGDAARFPERIRAPVGVGPEIMPEALPQLRGLVIDRVGPSTLWPMVVRDRVMGFLLARDRPAVDLEALAGQAALALELASGYTDALHAVRRRKDTSPAAEIQQNLLPPRLARVNGADVAGGVLPGYDVGGDFFDYAGNADGLWLVVADATGKGNSAAALSSLAIGALRAARRAGAGLQEAAQLADEAILALDMERYLTMVLGSWTPTGIDCAGSTAAIQRPWSCAPMGVSTSSTASAPIRSASGSRSAASRSSAPGWGRATAFCCTRMASASAAPPTAAASARLACARSSPRWGPARQRRRCAAYRTQ